MENLLKKYKLTEQDLEEYITDEELLELLEKKKCEECECEPCECEEKDEVEEGCGKKKGGVPPWLKMPKKGSKEEKDKEEESAKDAAEVNKTGKSGRRFESLLTKEDMEKYATPEELKEWDRYENTRKYQTDDEADEEFGRFLKKRDQKRGYIPNVEDDDGIIKKGKGTDKKKDLEKPDKKGGELLNRNESLIADEDILEYATEKELEILLETPLEDMDKGMYLMKQDPGLAEQTAKILGVPADEIINNLDMRRMDLANHLVGLTKKSLSFVVNAFSGIKRLQRQEPLQHVQMTNKLPFKR